MEVMKSPWTRNRMVGVLVVILLLGSVPFVYDWYEDATYDLPEGDYKDLSFETQEEATRYFDALEQAYREDTYGGDTPEETMRLFADALERDDIELASKYALVEKQADIRQSLTISKENNVLPRIVEGIQDGGSGYHHSGGDYFEFNTSEDESPGFIFNLVKNPYTGVWKIEEL